MDPISDMLTTIRNAQAMGHAIVKIPFSKVKNEIAKILEREGWIKQVERFGKKKKFLKITLKYNENKMPAISGLKRISKPGQRIYKSSLEIKKVKGGYGMAIISTSKGLMTDREAKKNKLGGEVMFEIW